MLIISTHTPTPRLTCWCWTFLQVVPHAPTGKGGSPGNFPDWMTLTLMHAEFLTHQSPEESKLMWDTMQ